MRNESKRNVNRCSHLIVPIDDSCNYCCGACGSHWCFCTYCWYSPESKVHGVNMEPTWVLSAPDGPHVGHMNLAIRALFIDLCLMTHIHISMTAPLYRMITTTFCISHALHGIHLWSSLNGDLYKMSSQLQHGWITTFRLMQWVKFRHISTHVNGICWYIDDGFQ